jgi:glutamate-1-semialdehyde 2,1-aminomutase
MIDQHISTADNAARRRAELVIPKGVYGHQSAVSAGFPQFIQRADGCRVWDLDGNEYVDFMCGYGPILLGYHHSAVDAAIARQAELSDCSNGPGLVMVELAELLVDTVDHADWAMFAKNGTDATTTCVTIARSATGRRKVLVAEGAYHGAAPWCTPRMDGVVDEDRAHLIKFRYNDIGSFQAAVEAAGGDLAAVVVSPFRHDARHDQELVDIDFARAVRRACDEQDAALVLDDVRCGFRMAVGGSWEPIGVKPDLSAWSKAIANGQPLAAVLGNERFREGAAKIYVTGSFWFTAVPMAAAIATIHTLRNEASLQKIVEAGDRLRAGLAAQASSHGLLINQTGPSQMPMLTFAGDVDFARAGLWASTTAKNGAYFHPWHNWFTMAAHTDVDVDRALLATDEGFAAVRCTFGGD